MQQGPPMSQGLPMPQGPPMPPMGAYQPQIPPNVSFIFYNFSTTNISLHS